MADDGNDLNPIDLGALGLLGKYGLQGAASGFKAAAPYLGRATGMALRGGAAAAGGPVAAGLAGGYEMMKPTPANAGEADQYVRGPDGQMVPNPEANHTLNGEMPKGDDWGAYTPSTGTDYNAPDHASAQVADGGGDPWMGKGAFDMAGGTSDPMVRGKPLSALPAHAEPARYAGGGGGKGGVTSDGQITGAPSSGGFFGSIGNKIKQHSNMLLGLGAGLAGKRSFGEAMSGGFSGAAVGNQADISQNMTQGGIRAGYQYLVNAGVDPNQALAAVYNPELYKTLISRLNPEPKMVSGGVNADGTERHYMQIGGSLVSPELAASPKPVHTFEEALRLPKGVPFSLPDGRMGIR